MKWFFYIVLFLSVFHSKVQGAKTASKPKEIISLEVEPVSYGADNTYLEEGVHKKIVCKGSHRFQKIVWYDPSGELVKHEPDNRVFVQEHFVPAAKSRPQSVLVITNALVKDSGVWECHSGDLKQIVPLCILEPAQFVDTPTEVTVDEGRSITLTCQSKGNPEPNIQWLRDGEVLSDNATKIFTSTKYNHHGFEGLLTIKSLTPEDSGTYMCKAEQTVPDVDCEYTTSINITLNVNHSPKFDADLETIYEFAQFNDSVQLICAPSAFPVPKFRWFREIGEMLTEYSEKQFKVSDDGSQSVLPLIANASTFDQKFICQANNKYGEGVQRFQVLRMIKPVKLSEINFVNATCERIEFSPTWNEDIDFFPVDGFDIQFFEKRASGTPKETQWKKVKLIHYELPYNVFETDINITIPLNNLKERTEYWVRMRAVNNLGVAPWSAPILASTVEAEPEDLNEGEDSQEEEESEIGEGLELIKEADYGIFYGLFFASAIVLFAAICIFFVKRV